MKPVFITGPTGIGKTDIAVTLAKEIGADIISADSVQIYRAIGLGSGKPLPGETKGVRIFLMDHVNPGVYYSAYNFALDVKEALKEIRGGVIVAGGCGLFIETLIRGIAPDIPRDERTRKEIKDKAAQSSWGEMRGMLAEVDPAYAGKISPNDKVRITRALEIYFLTGRTVSSLETESHGNAVFREYRIFNITMERKALYERIEKRIDGWFDAGWIEEVKNLKEKKVIGDKFRALGFNEINDFLEGRIHTKYELIDTVKKHQRNYAKGQITWFKRYRERIDIPMDDGPEKALEKIKEHLKKDD